MHEYPVTRTTPTTEEIFGHTITDDYRWLEDSDSPEVVAWSKAQNNATAKILKANAPVGKLTSEMASLMKESVFSLPGICHGWYYWTERQAGQNQAVIFRSQGLQGEREVLLDPNTLSDDGTIAVSKWGRSPFNKYFYYVLSEKGNEAGKLYIRDLNTGTEQTLDTIPNVRYPSLAWLDDETEFYYTNIPEPGTVPKGEEYYHHRVARHKIGRAWTEDEVIFGEGGDKKQAYQLSLSEDDATLVISATTEWSRNDIYLCDVATSEVRPFMVGLPAIFGLSFKFDKVYLYTTFDAEFGRILSCPAAELSSDLTGWAEIIPEVIGRPLVKSRFTADFMLIEYLEDAHSTLQLRDHNGTFIRDVPLPANSTLSGVSTHSKEREFFYSITGYTTPFTSFRYVPEVEKFVPYRAAEVGADLSDLEVVMEWAVSKDGTRIPMFVVRTSGLKLDSTHPTILYGYGGFNVNSTPSFMRLSLPWITRGGIWVDAVLRGGGEYGEAWHKAGITPHKQNTFDDFIACAERLIELGYTSPKHLGIMGGSNGGLLVAAVMVQRPELFNAVVCRVPLIDMVRFPMFLIASRWVSEYGDPTDPDDLKRILEWSPYHNVVPGTKYPPLLIMTGDHDTRVEPLHARKFAAMLQAQNGGNPVLLRTEIDAGHGAGTPINKAIAASADYLGFFCWQLGLIVD